MSKLIARKLSQLETGAAIEVKYSEGSITGTVGENDHEESLEILTDDGASLILQYSEVQLVKLTKKAVEPGCEDGDCGKVAEKPAAGPTEKKEEPVRPAAAMHFRPFYRHALDWGQLRDDQLKQRFGDLTKEQKKQLSTPYEQLMYGLRISDQPKIRQAVRNLQNLLTENEELACDPKAGRLAGEMLRRAGADASRTFGKCGAYCEAALSSEVIQDYPWAGAYAVQGLLAEAPETNLDALFMVLDQSCRKTGDVLVLEWLLDQPVHLSQDHMTALLQSLSAEAGMALPENMTISQGIHSLKTQYPNREILDCVLSLQASAPKEELEDTDQIPDGVVLAPNEQGLLCGRIVKLSWVSERGTIQYQGETLSFSYDDITGEAVKNAVQSYHQNSNMDGKTLDVCFRLKNKRAVDIQEGPLIRLGRAKINHAYASAWYWQQRAMEEPLSVPKAVQAALELAMDQYSNSGDQDVLSNAVALYQSHREQVDGIWSIHLSLSQIYRYMGKDSEALEACENAEKLCVENKAMASVFQREITILKKMNESQPDLAVQERLGNKCLQCIQFAEEHQEELKKDQSFLRSCSGDYVVYLLAYACEIGNTKLIQSVLPKLKEDCVKPDVYQNIMARVQRIEQLNRPSEAKKHAPDPDREKKKEAVPTQKEPPQPESDPEEEAEPKLTPYQDTDGWPKLKLTKKEVVDYAIALRGEERLPRMLVYLKAASELNPASFGALYQLMSLAADNPAFDCDYSVEHLVGLLGNLDPDYPVLSSCCLAAACLRAVFSNSGVCDFNINGLHDSLDLFQQLPCMEEVYQTMYDFSRWYKCAVDDFAKYHEATMPVQKKKMEQTLLQARNLYQQFILTPPREEAKFARNVATKKIAFDRDGTLAVLLQKIIGQDQEGLMEKKEAFKAQWISAGKSLTSSAISQEAVDDYINQCWAEAGKKMDAQSRGARLQGSRRNNLRSSVQSILSVICSWYELAGHQQIQDNGQKNEAKSAYDRISNGLIQQMQTLAEVCGQRAQQKPLEEACGLFLLQKTAQDLLGRLNGQWNQNARRYLYIDFLRSDWVLLDDNYLPDTDATFCALADYNVLARIRHHCEENHPELKQRIQEIFSRQPSCNNYGTANLIRNYLSETTQCLLDGWPEDADSYIKQTSRRAKRNLDRFCEDYILSVSYGQIIQNDPFLVSLEQTVRWWYYNCKKTKNYGFWFKLVEQCYTQIHQVAAQYGTQLEQELKALVANNAEFFVKNPQVEQDIRNQIEKQNYTVAEDWMNRVRRGDFGTQYEPSTAVEYLKQFWNEFSANFNLVRDAGTALRNITLRNSAAKDRRGGQTLIDNWLTNGNPSTVERMTQLLQVLGWNNIQVSRIQNNPTGVEIYRVTQREHEDMPYNVQHPIADFGSKITTASGFCLVCLYGIYDCDRLLARFQELDGISGAKLVLLDYAMTEPERRKLARKIKKKESGMACTYLVLDRVGLVYLAQHYNRSAVNQMLMAIGMPFAYYQPYVADSSNTMPPEMFIGRKDELRKIKNPGGVNLIYGGRQLGKTALFKQARAEVDGYQGRRAVLVDLANHNCAQSAAKLSQELIELQILPQKEPTENWDELAAWIKTRLRDVASPISFLLVMLDEADDFVEDCKKCNYQPIAALKDIQQTMPEQFKFVLAGLHNIVRFNHEVALGRNAVITHLSHLNVKPFERPEAQELLVRPLSYLGFQLEDNVLISQVLATTNYFPGLIQLYGQKLIESMRQNNYAGYNENTTPPYVITEDHIRRVLADDNFLHEIQSKFETTLRLDEDQGSYYYTIALLIGLMYTTMPTTVGYTADDLLKQAKDLGISNLTKLDLEQMATLLRELYDLNILRSTGKDLYLFASKNFHDLLGNETEIFEKLSQIGGGEG